MTQNQIQIRQATVDDLDSIAKFNSAMALETEGKILDFNVLHSGVSAVLASRTLGFYLVAQRDDQAVGQLMITTEWSDWRNGYFWWIQSVYVNPEHRRQGVFRALYDQVVWEAGQTGDVCGIRLYVDQDNLSAQQVYNDLGMEHSHYFLYEVEF